MNIRREIIKRISPYMKSKGFSFSKNSFYYINNDIAFCIAIDMPSGIVYVTSYVMPLYIPCECIYYTYGNRLSMVQGITLPLLQKDSTDKVIEEWCSLLCHHIEEYVVPFYETIATPMKLLACFGRKKEDLPLLSACPQFFVERLRLFTWLYQGNIAQAETVMKRIKKTLLTDTFFTDTARQNYLSEISFIQLLIQEGQLSVQNMLLNSIAKTESFFFRRPKTGDGSLSWNKKQ